MNKLRLILSIGILPVFLQLNAQNAGDYQSKASGNWNSLSTWERFDGTSWQPPTVAPSSSDGRITIKNNHTITITVGITIDETTIVSGGSLIILSTTITVTDGMGIDLECMGFFSLSHGTVIGNGQISINAGGIFEFFGQSTMGGSLVLTLQVGAIGAFTLGNAGLNGTLINNGTINWHGGNLFTTGNLINNGTININVDINMSSSAGSPSFINNATGIINKFSPGETSLAAGSPFTFTNSGQVNVQQGTLILQGQGTQTGSFNISAGKTLVIQGLHVLASGSTFNSIGGQGTVRFNFNTIVVSAGCQYSSALNTIITSIVVWDVPVQSFSDLELSHERILGSSDITILNNFCWCGSSRILGTGTFTVPSGATATFSSANTVLDKNFVNNGTINWNSNHGVSGAGTFTNNGVLNKSGSAALAFVNSASGIVNEINPGIRGYSNLTNNGEINILNGKVNISGGQHTGSIKMSSGKVIELQGTQNFNAGASIVSLGIEDTVILNGTINFNSGSFYDPTLYTNHFNAVTNWNIPNQTIRNYRITGTGVISGNANLEITNSFCSCADFGNDILGSGTLTFSNTCVATFFTSNSTVTKTLINNGIMNWTNSNGWNGSGTFLNNGIFNMTANGFMGISFTNSPTGVLNKITGTGSTTFTGIFNNSGQVNVHSGRITLEVNGLHDGSYVIHPGGTLNGPISMPYTGPAITNNGIITLGNLKFKRADNQQLNGSGLIANLTAEGVGGLTLGGSQTITNSLTLTNGKISLENNNLLLGGATLTGGSNASYIVTNGSGAFQRSVSTPALFPVGTSISYTPMTITPQAGHITDDLKARVLDNVYTDYDATQNPSGTIIPSNLVNRTWLLSETIPGGSNADVKLEWNSGDQSSGFSSLACRFGTFSGGVWNLGNLSDAGSPASLTKTNVNTFFPMTVIGQFVAAVNSYSPQCGGNTIPVNYSPVGTFNNGNVFTAELSNGAGSFASPQNLGSLVSTSAGVINAVIPANTVFGTGYRIRMRSSNPVSTGSDNGSNITINPKSNAGIIIGDGEVCRNEIINYISTGETGGVWESTNPAVLSIDQVTGQATALAEGVTTIKYTVGIACPGEATRNIVVTGIPQIIAHPVGLTKCAGETAVFSVSATGFNLSYQWRRNGQSLPGQTSSTCLIGTISLADAGTYDVVIDNGCNSITTPGAILIVQSAPEIIVQPASSSVCLGQPLQLSVTASGDGLTYQWFKNGSVLLGQTSNNLDIPAVNLFDAGDYQVVINGICAPEAESLVATVTVNQAPVFEGPLPSTIFRCPGDNFILSGAATGNNVSYQWFKNNVPIQGATNLLFEINGLVPSNSGSYHVVASNICGVITSNHCVLLVPQSPVIITQPVAQTFCPGQTVTLSVIATGDGLTYDWRKNGISVFGGTNSSYQTNETGNYSVVISGPCAQIESDIVVVLEIIPPFIFQNPLSHSVCLGSVSAFTAVAMNNFSGIQWTKDGIDIPGETNSLLLINPVTPAHAGTYRLKVFWECNPPVLSQPAVLTINEPVLVQQPPVNQTSCIGDLVEFTVGATGTGLTYHWFKGNTLINGATSSILQLGPAHPALAGVYNVSIGGTCQTSNIFLSASLTVNEPPVIITQPISQSTCVGSPVTFSVVASGTNLQYQWQKGFTNIIGATSSSYSIGSAALGDIGSYSVIISGDCSGPITSNIVTLSIGDPPLITSQPVSQAKCIGQSITFSVGASGNNLSYQWRKGGFDIVGATNSSYTILSVSQGDVGSYDVVIDNSCSSVTSNVATLSLLPVITAGSISGPAALCRNKTFQFTTTGSPNGMWESSDPAIATVNPSNGLVTTLIAGTTNIIYRVSGCANPSFSSRILNVEPYLTASPITGPSSFCSSGLGIQLIFETILSGEGNYSGTGTDWSVSSPLQISFAEFVNVGNGLLARAYLNHTNLVAGTYQIQFNPSNGCGIQVPVSKTFQVIQAPDPGTITGSAFICLSAIASYSHGAINGNGNGNGGGGGSNGTWSVSNPSILSLVSSNTNSASVRGLNQGIAHLIYTVTNGTCSDTVRKTITVGIASQLVCPVGAPFTRIANQNCEYEIIGTEFDLSNPILCNGILKYTLGGATSKTRAASTLNGVILEKGTTTITWIFTSQGISISCSFLVTVKDQTAPVIICPNNITATTNACSRTISTPRPSVSDNCSMDRDMTLTWKIEKNNQIIAISPATGLNYVGTRSFGIGVSKITYTLTDEAGNSNSCSFTVTVSGGLFCLSKGIVDNENVELVGFNVIISPNPTASYFRLSIESDTHEDVVIRIYDVSGRNVELFHVSPYNPFEFGLRMRAGIYMAEITQGKYRKLIKLVKH